MRRGSPTYKYSNLNGGGSVGEFGLRLSKCTANLAYSYHPQYWFDGLLGSKVVDVFL